MKNVVLLFFSLIIVCTTKAQTTEDYTTPDMPTRITINSKQYNEMLKEFRKKGTMQMAYHLENCKWRGMNLQEFNDIFAAEEMGYDDKNYTKRLLLNFNDIMQQYSGLKEGDTAPFIAHIIINKVEKDAAIDAKALVVYKGSVPFALINLNVEAGRWNKFSVLWRENVERMAKRLKKKLQDYRAFMKESEDELLIKDKW